MISASCSPSEFTSEGHHNATQQRTLPVTLTFAEKPFVSAASTNHPPPESAETWTVDLMLMHHYSTATYATLPRGIERCDIWQQEIPRLADGNVFLMHQILATAAYHLAHTNPSQAKHYALHGLRHQNDAIVGLQAALPSLRTSNCDAFFAASSMLTISAFASAGADGAGETMTLDGLLDAFLLVRGMSNILDIYETALKAGRLGYLFKVAVGGDGCSVLRRVMRQLEDFVVPSDFDAAEAEVCRATVSVSLEWMRRRGSALRIALSWPICLGEDFVNLLRRRQPVALAILAHYAVLLHVAGLEKWYLRSWGQRVLEDISGSIDPQFRSLVAWPSTEM